VPVESLIPLELLEVGELAEVDEVNGDCAWVARMAELGIRQGTRLKLLRQGSPCIVEVGGARLSVRGEAGAHNYARPLTGAAR
jgi:ferrous iron transport protein A